MSRAPRASAIALWILAVIAVLFFVREASQLLIPIVLAILISYVLEPLVAGMARHHLPRIAGTSILLLAVLCGSAWGVYSLRDDAMQAVQAMPEAARRVRDVVTGNGGGPVATIREAASALGGTATSGGDSTQPRDGQGTSARQADPDGQSPQQSSHSQPGSREDQSQIAPAMTGIVQRGLGSVFAVAGHVIVIFFLVFFLLLSGHHFRTRVVEIAGPDAERRGRFATIIDDINKQIQRFLIVRLITAAVVGVVTWLVLAWMNVEHAALWGMLAGIFNSIPYFGPIIVSGGLLIVGMVQGDGLTQALQMAGAALVITSLEGWLLTPPLMGKAERMSALAVFLGLLLWTWIWGPWGTILAVPMLVILKAVADHTPSLKPLGRLMAP